MKVQRGFTLIEIMISLLLGLIVLGATVSVYIAAIRGSADVVNSARLNYDLDSALSLMANDIRRTGYWGGAIAGSDPSNNPFMQNTTNLQILDGGTCILYSYDGGSGNTGGIAHDGNGGVDPDEYYGFKLNGTSIEMRLSGTTTANCNDGTWQTMNVTDGGQQLEITGLQFSLSTPATSKCLNVTTDGDFDSTCTTAQATAGNINDDDWLVESRQVNIVLQGRVANDTAVTKAVSQSVKLRNDRIFQW